MSENAKAKALFQEAQRISWATKPPDIPHRAIELAEAALAEDPSFVKAAELLANDLRRARNYEKSSAMYKYALAKAQELEPGNPKQLRNILRELGKVLILDQKYEEATEFLERSLEIELSSAQEYLAEAYNKLGRHQDVIRLYSHVEQMSENGRIVDEPALHLGRAYKALGNSKKAKEVLESGLQFNPVNEDIKAELKKMDSGGFSATTASGNELPPEVGPEEKRRKNQLWLIVILLLGGAIGAVALYSHINKSQELVIAIPYEQPGGKFYSIYPISIFSNGRYYENKTGGSDNEATTVFEKNKLAIDIVNRSNKFLAFSDSQRIGTFSTKEVSYAQGLGCEYTFSPIGNLHINNMIKQHDRNVAVLITDNDKIKTYNIDTNAGSVVKNKLSPLLTEKIKSFGLKISNISWEYIKRIKLGQGNDLIIAMTSTTLSSPHSFYESAGATSNFDTLSIFQDKDGNLSLLYLNNPDQVIYTEFIWAGDIEGDGEIELILREAYGEFGRFVIFRLQQDRLIKVFEGTEYGC